ncbi:MAG TPA: pyridoxal-dependent decarboxylase [Acidimicrobiales bacterium]|nr:pyridoxal-dependent decarboxylase [Acidimicrobiales bacterium]
MTPEEFRKYGYALVDWIADYLEGVEQRPVSSPHDPGWVRSQLPAGPPAEPEPFDAVLADLDRVILPGLTHWQHPSFFAYFPANTSYPAILGELASAGLGVNGMSWATSPACTELETLMADWMVDLLGLPDWFRSTGPGGGVIHGSASEATLCAILAARERATAGGGNRSGAPGDLVAYATSQAHSSIEKGVRIAGIGSDNLRTVAHDDALAMRPDALEAAIAEDRARGRRPFFVCATAGTTSTTAFDPVPELAAICRQSGLWLHLDSAMSGIAALCPELRWVNSGLDQVDSYCTNPHKWMGVNFDCDLFWVADRSALLSALSILPEYLRTAAGEAGAVIDYRDWQIPLGRRFRALKLWFTLRCDGVAPIQAMLRDHVSLAQELAGWVAADDRFAIVAPHPLNLVCVALRAGDDATDALAHAANATGEALFTRSVADGRSFVRFCVGGRTTQRHHVESGWRLLQSLANDLV